MSNYLENIPFGFSIPKNNPHAISVSFPTIADVEGYEKGDNFYLDKMKSGYPRFFRNTFVKQIVDFVRMNWKIDDSIEILPLTSIDGYKLLVEICCKDFEIIEFHDCVFVKIEKNDKELKSIKDFVRNIGIIISSRKAEKTLLKLGLIKEQFYEDKLDYNIAIDSIYSVLSKAYKTNQENLHLTNCGANAIFAAIESIKRSNPAKKIIVQLGWLYLDTMEIIQKRAEEVYLQINPFQLLELEEWLNNNHKSVAVIVTELVSNPKLQCVDVKRLYEICQKFEIKLIVDATLATPYHVDVLNFCDIAIESLSKFASGNADLLMGLIVVKNLNLLSEIRNFTLAPYKGEIERLGFEIQGYESRVERISENTKKLIAYFQSKPQLKNVYFVYSGSSLENYSKIKSSDGIPGLISIVTKRNLGILYDYLPIAKGPSLGTDFTLVMPYVYLAHFDLMQTEEGNDYLKVCELDSNLLRISVGCEPVEEIISAFELAFESF